jgi:hypothetical protein
MEAMKEAARQGLSGKEAADMAGNVFDYERRTGADRSTLMGISTMAARYGAGDALGAGWQGLQASGMKQGQYNEYLRAMQRVMEDGISKGFSKSAKEIAGDLTFIKEMSGGSELWKGEQGQQRLSQMSAGLEASTGLASSSDILAFRGAQNVIKGMDDEGWKKITDLDKNGTSDIKRSGSYIDAMILMERGLNADTFSEIMKLNDNAEGGDRSAVVERMRQQFGLNYTNSAMLYDQWAQQTDYGTKEMSTEDAQALVDTYGKKPPPANNPELEVAKITQEIRNIYTQSGMIHWDKTISDLQDELLRAIQEYKDLANEGTPTPVEETLGNLEAVATNPLSTGDDILSARNAAIEAQVAEGKMMGTVKNKTKMMFDEWFGSSEDKEAYRNVNSIFSTALSSRDTGEREAAIQFANIIGSMKETEKGAIEKYNNNDTWNHLGSAVDIHGLISALERLTEKMEDVNINIE